MALRVGATLGGRPLVTTDEVLSEVVTLLSARGRRHMASEVVRAILSDPDVRVVEQSRESFLRGLAYFEQRQEREYSLTDCISMSLMRELGIFEVLTHDHHFEQEGFQALLRQ